ncbi:MAG: hypothetical protein KW806_03060 [Candidatus Yanofskybacteria bacterium]|nr:hypothetical protein [Candidatus Yanofskybacteria bacterium]
MKNYGRIIIISLVLLGVLTSVAPALAAPSWWPIVPCGINNKDAVKNASGTDPEGRALDYSKPCSRCDLLKLLKNLIDFIFMGLAPILGTFFVVWAGIQILLAGPNITSYQDGIHKLWIVVQALFILGLAWLITNTLIKSLGAQYDGADNWYQFTCTESAQKPEFTVLPGGETTAECNDLPALAQKNNVIFPRTNSSALNTLITCIRTDPSVAGLIDLRQIYTYEQTNNACNYTRGSAICGECAHAVNSCHYGGKAGTQGSEAADFNALDGKEQELNQKIQALKSKCNLGFILFENDHTHVSTMACDGN